MEIDKHNAVEKAVDQAFVLFQTFGWQYFDGEPDRRRIREVLEKQIDAVLEGGRLGSGSGRFYVRRFEEEDLADEIQIFLDLASFIDDDAE